MMTDIDDLFKGMADKPINGGGNYMSEGLYEIRTKDVFVKRSDNPLKPGSVFICEFEITKSDNPKHAVGSSSSWVLHMSNPYAMGNISELVMALLGYPSTKENQTNKQIRDEIALVTRAACGSEVAKKDLGADYEDCMLHGVVLKLECTKKPTKAKDGKPAGEFTVHKWSPTAETLAANAA